MLFPSAFIVTGRVSSVGGATFARRDRERERELVGARPRGKRDLAADGPAPAPSSSPISSTPPSDLHHFPELRLVLLPPRAQVPEFILQLCLCLHPAAYPGTGSFKPLLPDPAHFKVGDEACPSSVSLNPGAQAATPFRSHADLIDRSLAQSSVRPFKCTSNE
ncbi:uncharacterized protein K452DRAFT_309369 [Aplosporella prunicola CBS 121167]|uniref:Uncharacterized protein n=1 Tax=Aplosporella prunicola CBS 121167 TaxID=1176127 RepID=A0A6A6BA16_9PEZI|nr:uncharacterized protein K452DRAFT_309369 [Aplosporella prunicola CBS 121167]KAF2140910.1 hypothetical protein K452DRAFT_309369 [Aplosporella prunicola CBS 121167]